MKILIGIVLAVIAESVSAQFWDATEVPTADAFVANPNVAQYVKQPISWCHYQARNSFPDFYVGLYAGGPTSCQDFPVNPPELMEVTTDLLADRDGLVTLGCVSQYPRTVYLAQYLGGINGMSHRLFPDHLALRYSDPDADRARATRAHELMHLATNAALGGAQIGNTWYSEAASVWAERMLLPDNTAHIYSHVPWPLYWSWGLNNAKNPHGRYHLGIFLEYLQNRFAGQFNVCDWLRDHNQVLAVGDTEPVWESLSVALGGQPNTLELIRDIWADFVHDMNLRKTEYTPSMVELPFPGITAYPPGGSPPMDYDLSGTREGDIWQIDVPSDGILTVQWQPGRRCGGEPAFLGRITVQGINGERLASLHFGGALGLQSITGLPPGPVTLAVSSLEGNVFFTELYVNVDQGWIVSTGYTDAQAAQMRKLDPWPHIEVVQTQYGPQEQCVPGYKGVTQ